MRRYFTETIRKLIRSSCPVCKLISGLMPQGLPPEDEFHKLDVVLVHTGLYQEDNVDDDIMFLVRLFDPSEPNTVRRRYQGELLLRSASVGTIDGDISAEYQEEEILDYQLLRR